MSENLLPFAAYQNATTIRWGRMALAAGLFWGLLMWIVAITFTIGFGPANRAGGNLRLVPVITGICILGAALFGIPWTCFIRWSYAKNLRRVYDRDPSFAPAPADDARFRYRLPAGYYFPANKNSGGILYLSGWGLTFQPHLRNLPARREPFTLGPLHSLRFNLVPHEVNFVSRLLNKPLPPLVEITFETANGRFSVPQPQETIKLLEAAIEELSESTFPPPVTKV